MLVKALWIVLIVSLLSPSSSNAAPMSAPMAPAARTPMGPDPIGQHLFPPDFVIAHGDAVGLTQSQRDAIESAAITARRR